MRLLEALNNNATIVYEDGLKLVLRIMGAFRIQEADVLILCGSVTL